MMFDSDGAESEAIEITFDVMPDPIPDSSMMEDDCYDISACGEHGDFGY